MIIVFNMKVLLNQHNSKEKQFKFVIVGEQACGKVRDNLYSLIKIQI